jgi:hypothetical protein
MATECGAAAISVLKAILNDGLAPEAGSELSAAVGLIEVALNELAGPPATTEMTATERR